MVVNELDCLSVMIHELTVTIFEHTDFKIGLKVVRDQSNVLAPSACDNAQAMPDSMLLTYSRIATVLAHNGRTVANALYSCAF